MHKTALYISAAQAAEEGSSNQPRKQKKGVFATHSTPGVRQARSSSLAIRQVVEWKAFTLKQIQDHLVFSPEVNANLESLIPRTLTSPITTTEANRQQK